MQDLRMPIIKTSKQGKVITYVCINMWRP